MIDQNLVLFESNPDFADNSRALYDYIIDKTDFKTFWVVKDPAMLGPMRAAVILRIQTALLLWSNVLIIWLLPALCLRTISVQGRFMFRHGMALVLRPSGLMKMQRLNQVRLEI